MDFLETIGLGPRLDFLPCAFDRTTGGKPGLTFTSDDLATRRRLLKAMLAASRLRSKEVVELRFTPQEQKLVYDEIRETVENSGAILLCEYYPHAPSVGPKEGVGLRRSDLIFTVGNHWYSYCHRWIITKGFEIRRKDAISHCVLLSFNQEEAERQREEIKQRAAQKGHTYLIRVDFKSNADVVSTSIDGVS